MENITAEERRMDSTLAHCRIGGRLKEGGSNKDVPLTDVITRHVKQVADFNKALEKRQLWREREKELAAKHGDTWGVLRSEGRSKRHSECSPFPSSCARKVLDTLEVEGVDEEIVEQVKKKVARTFGSLDARAGIRQRLAKQKEERQLRLHNEVSDSWMTDRFYTEELNQKTPWLNPVEFLSNLQPPNREASLTPVASDSDGDTRKSKKKSKRKRKHKKHKKSRKARD